MEGKQEAMATGRERRAVSEGKMSAEAVAERDDQGLPELRKLASAVTGTDRVRVNDQEVEIGLLDPNRLKGRPRDLRFESEVEKIHERYRKIGGVPPATVVNFLAEDLVSAAALPDLRQVVVRGPAFDQPYTFHTFRHVSIEPSRPAENYTSANEHIPLDLAMEFERQYLAKGGVIAFAGEVSELEDPRNEQLRALWEERKRGAINHMLGLHQQALAWYNTPGHQDSKWIQDPHRRAAQRLHALGHLPELPDYVTAKRADYEKPAAECRKCGKRPDKNAVICECGYVLEPRRAFENQVIDENHPSLERLTRVEVKEMGISDYVAETVDEKPTRLLSSKPKPMSLAAFRMQEDQRRAEKELAKLAASQKTQVPATAGVAPQSF